MILNSHLRKIKTLGWGQKQGTNVFQFPKHKKGDGRQIAEDFLNQNLSELSINPKQYSWSSENSFFNSQ